MNTQTIPSKMNDGRLWFTDSIGNDAAMSAEEREAIERTGRCSHTRYAFDDPPELALPKAVEKIAAIAHRPGQTEGGGVQGTSPYANPWDNDPNFVRDLIAYHRHHRETFEVRRMVSNSSFIKKARQAARKRHKKLPGGAATPRKSDEVIKPMRWTAEERKALRSFNGGSGSRGYLKQPRTEARPNGHLS
jgi:hypothetical protein